jgi:ribosomal protein L7/L12
MIERNDTLKECREKLVRGAELEEVIRTLRSNGFSKVHSMKALVDLGQASLSEAKQIVHNSPTWADVRDRDEEFQSGLDG